MLSSRKPFSPEIDHRKCIEDGAYYRMEGADSGWETISKDAKDLVEKMLTVDPAKRIDINGIFDHPWLQKAQPEYVEDNEVFDPEYRNRMKKLGLKDKLRECFNFDIQVKRESFRDNLQKTRSGGIPLDDVNTLTDSSSDNATYAENYNYNTNLQNLRRALVDKIFSK